jgi:hypothetical protein
LIATLGVSGCSPVQLEPRGETHYLRGPYNFAQYDRHNDLYENSAAIHFGHAVQHDILELSPIASAQDTDRETDKKFLESIHDPPRIEPHMDLYGPYTARFAWGLFQAIDWTHMHHGQTYDVMADAGVPWEEKPEWTRRAVDYYLRYENQKPRSVAPLDITMRRAGTMMKPYFGCFRNKYPLSNNFFYYAHWWHPVIYEAQMLGGNGPKQDEITRATHETGLRQVLRNRPQRMLLSREMMPRYSRMSPESANIFDNLHMLHGIAYDILCYEGWSPSEKRKELYRVIDAMAYQPGDERFTRKFALPHPDMDPRSYEGWMQGYEGSMNKIMEEMMMEMMPSMMPDGQEMSPDMHRKMMAQLRMKLTPGMEAGETPGSLHDAMMKLMPDMKMDPSSMKAGASSDKMVEAMLRGWEEKHGAMEDVPSWPMKRVTE